MKLFALIAILGLTQAAISAEHVCNEFVGKQHQAKNEFENFDREFQKLISKLNSLEQRVMERRSALSSLTSQRDGLINEIQSLQSELQGIDQQLAQSSRLQLQLRSEIDTKRSMSQNYFLQASRISDFALKREYLREAKRLEKEVELALPRLTQMDQEQGALMARKNHLPQLIAQKNTQVSEVSRRLTEVDVMPSLAALERLRGEAQAEVNNSEALVRELQSNLSRANFHVEMCFGYIELSVKYPTVLDTAKQINTQGCRFFRAVDYRDEFKNAAQNDALRVICNQ